MQLNIMIHFNLFFFFNYFSSTGWKAGVTRVEYFGITKTYSYMLPCALMYHPARTVGFATATYTLYLGISSTGFAS